MPAELTRNLQGRLLVNCRVEAVPTAAEVESGGARLLNVAGDDLLGLGSDTRVRTAAVTAIKEHGLSQLGGGKVQAALEARAANLLGAEAALVIDHESALLDLLPTWRLLTCARSRRTLADAPQVASPEEADQALATPGVLGMVLEALHPLEGDLTVVPRYAEVCQRHHAHLILIDDALGVLGPNGGGAAEHLSLQEQTTLRLVPLGGAIPGAGALVLGSEQLVETFRGVRPAPPTASLAATAKALDISVAEPARRARLFDVTQKLLAGLRARGFDTGPCVTPWVPAWIGDEALCLKWMSSLAELGVACRGWLAGPRSRLLLTPTATLTDSQLNQLLDVFDRLSRKLTLPVAASTVREVPTLARPGSYAMGSTAALHWTTVEPRERRPLEVSTPAEPVQSPEAENLSLADRVYDAVETVTWRATSVYGAQLRRSADALRALLDKRRR
ncbi:MAG: hypothetical protein DI536_03250 [Archangium gephyra]|uniref:Aminotransferase class III-fold pyridoxal phosphate-dependent enzyme n=1 Tax=Archangium gephyra TaxID=48 RepID=A0A2W5VNK6_9BACT|nr:MAG: hypothetical protein DI536_03250 [Archangium gephyra]